LPDLRCWRPGRARRSAARSTRFWARRTARTIAPHATTARSATCCSRPARRAATRRVGERGRAGLRDAASRRPAAEAYGVASFYALLALEERPTASRTTAPTSTCSLKGASVPPGGHASPCLGLCERAPAAYRTVAGEQPVEEQIPAAGPPLPQAASRACGSCAAFAAGVDPESIDAYIQAGGFESLRRARELGPEAVLKEVAESRLLGRGGAAFRRA